MTRTSTPIHSNRSKKKKYLVNKIALKRGASVGSPNPNCVLTERKMARLERAVARMTSRFVGSQYTHVVSASSTTATECLLWVTREAEAPFHNGPTVLRRSSLGLPELRQSRHAPGTFLWQQAGKRGEYGTTPACPPQPFSFFSRFTGAGACRPLSRQEGAS